MDYDSLKNAYLEYDIYNQLKTVTFPIGIGTDSLVFGYNTDGQRVYKRYIHYHTSEDCGGGDFESFMMQSLGGGLIEPPPITICTLRVETPIQYVRSKLNNQVLAEYDFTVGANTTDNYIYAGDKRIAMVDDSGTVFYYLNDHLGSTRVIVRDNGTIYERNNRYLAFGGDDGSSTTLNNAYKYTGKPFDDEHGFDLFYYGARYYDPFTGRFISVDPMNSDFPAWSPYHYTYNNPIMYTDPNGEAGFVAGALIGAAVDYGFQVVSNRLDGQSWGDALTNVDKSSIVISAVAGGTGAGVAGLIDKANKLSVAGKLLAEGGVNSLLSVGEQVANGEDVNLISAGADAIVGTLVGEGAEYLAKNINLSTATGQALDEAKKNAKRKLSNTSSKSAKKKSNLKKNYSNSKQELNRHVKRGTVAAGIAGGNVATHTLKELEEQD